MSYIYHSEPTGVDRNPPFYVISPAAGTIVKFSAVLEGHDVNLGPGELLTLQLSIGGVDVSLGLLTIEAPGIIYSVVPTAANVVAESQLMTITPNISIGNDNVYISLRAMIHILRS